MLTYVYTIDQRYISILETMSQHEANINRYKYDFNRLIRQRASACVEANTMCLQFRNVTFDEQRDIRQSIREIREQVERLEREQQSFRNGSRFASPNLPPAYVPPPPEERPPFARPLVRRVSPATCRLPASPATSEASTLTDPPSIVGGGCVAIPLHEADSRAVSGRVSAVSQFTRPRLRTQLRPGV